MGGQYSLFSRKPFSSYKQLGAFPCVYIVLAYLGAGWNRAPPPPADAATRCEHEAQFPWRIQNVESRSRGAPPLLPEPAVGCKPPTAAGKLFGSSSGLGKAAIPRRTGHGPRRPVHCCPGHGGKAGTFVHQRWTPASLFRERSRGFPTPVVLGGGVQISPSCLGAVCPRPKTHIRSGRVHTHWHPATSWRKQIEKWEITELVACRGCGELLKQHFSASAPLLSAQGLIQSGLHTVQIFVFNSHSFSLAFLGDFLSNAAYVYFLFLSQCLPSPMAVFFLL